MIDKKALAENFSAVAKQYEDVAVLQKTVLERLLERIDFLKINPKRILDLGSGTGLGSRLLKQRYQKAEIVEQDLSLGMLLQSRAMAQPGFLKRKNALVCADQECLPFSSDSFDLVLSSLSFQWSENINALIDEMNRVLRGDGLLLFSSLGTDSLCELKESWAEADNAPHVNGFHDIRDLGDALLNQGMSEPVLDSEVFTLTYNNAMDVLNDLKQTGVTNVQTERRKALTGKERLTKFCRAYEKFRSNGKLPLSYDVIYGHAWQGEAQKQNEDGVFKVPLSSLSKR